MFMLTANNFVYLILTVYTIFKVFEGHFVLLGLSKMLFILSYGLMTYSYIHMGHFTKAEVEFVSLNSFFKL